MGNILIESMDRLGVVVLPYGMTWCGRGEGREEFARGKYIACIVLGVEHGAIRWGNIAYKGGAWLVGKCLIRPYDESGEYESNREDGKRGNELRGHNISPVQGKKI